MKEWTLEDWSEIEKYLGQKRKIYKDYFAEILEFRKKIGDKYHEFDEPRELMEKYAKKYLVLDNKILAVIAKMAGDVPILIERACDKIGAKTVSLAMYLEKNPLQLSDYIYERTEFPNGDITGAHFIHHSRVYQVLSDFSMRISSIGDAQEKLSKYIFNIGEEIGTMDTDIRKESYRTSDRFGGLKLFNKVDLKEFTSDLKREHEWSEIGDTGVVKLLRLVENTLAKQFEFRLKKSK